MPVPNTFANATTSIPLSQLDTNFATAITLGNTAIQLGNTVSTLNNMTLANVTISSGTVSVANATVTGNVTMSGGNLSFTSTGQRITGDFSNGTQSNRVFFQTTTAGGGTSVGTIPNATGTNSAFNAFGGPDPGNASFAQLRAGSDTSDVRLTSGINGTGTYYPMTFYTGGSERMRIDTSGNVGIGTTSTTANAKLAVEQGIVARASTAGLVPYLQLYNSNAGTDLKTWRLGTDSAGSLSIETVNDAYSAAVQRLVINSSGNVGIGTSSPSSWSTLAALGSNSTGFAGITAINSNANVGIGGIQFASDTTYTKAAIGLLRSDPNGKGSLVFYNDSNSDAANWSTGDEKMRIDTSGNLLVGTTSSTVAGKNAKVTAYQTSSAPAITSYVNATTESNQIIFVNPNGEVGNINTNGTTTSYSTSSDYRLKYDVQPMLSGLSTIAALKPSTYKWNADNSYGEGFIAHELQAVIPQAVNGEKDGVNDDGSIKSQSVDYSKIVVHLVAAIQELKAEFDAYKAAHP